MSGQGGHAATFWAARAVCYGFDLGEVEGFHLLLAYFNPKCVPPWPEPELRRKCAEADTRPYEKPRGWLLDEGDDWRPLSPVRPGEAAAALGNLGATQAPAAPPATAPNPLAGRDEPAADPPPTPAPVETDPPTGPVTVSNFREVTTGDGARRLPLSPQQIMGDLLRLTGGWPKTAGGRLFAPGGEGGAPLWLDDVTAFFGWLQGQAGQRSGQVCWGREPSHVTKGEFLSWLATAVPDRYDAVECHPHEPPIPGVYYLHDPLPPATGGAFDDVLGFFNPATDTDRHLLRAMFLTPIWGGPAGLRPMFIIEASSHERPGQGTGKTTAAETVASLFGGYVSISLATVDEKDVQSRLLSQQGRARRVVICDNVKGTKVSSSLIEGYVTAETVSGKEMYYGEGSRPNHLAWIVTANGPSLSKCFATRSFVVRLDPAAYDPDWSARLKAYIAGHRPRILADMVAELRGPDLCPDPAAVAWSRWAPWERAVLARVCDPAPVLSETADRREAIDAEADVSALVREKIADFIRIQRVGLDPETAFVAITPDEMATAVGDLCPTGKNVIGVGKWLGTMHVRGLTRHRTTKGRFWVWRGAAADQDEPIPLSTVRD